MIAHGTVWERMLRTVLGADTIELPAGGYVRYDGERGGHGLRLEIDLVLEEPDRPDSLFVLDAKHYERGTWPGADSVHKQLLYRLYAWLHRQPGLSWRSIVNAFVGPASLGDCPTRVTGEHRVEREEGDRVWDFGIGRILFAEVDWWRVVKAYASHTIDHKLRVALISALWRSWGDGLEAH